MRQQSSPRYALRCLSAQGIAPSLCDEIQSLHEQNLAIAKETTIKEARAMVETELSKLPQYLEIKVNDNELSELLNNLL